MFFCALLAALAAFLIAMAVGIWRESSSYKTSLPDHTQAQPEAKAGGEADKPKEPRRESFWRKTVSDPINVFTLALVVFTLVLAVSTTWLGISTSSLTDFAEEQAGDMKRSLKIATDAANAARESADATKVAVELSDKTAERQLRAYVDVEFVGLKNFSPGERVEIAYLTHNSGQTPASDVTIFSWVGVAGFPLAPNTKVSEPDTKIIRSKTILFPTRTMRGTQLSEKPLTKEEIEGVKDGKTIRLYVVGMIRYIDAFGVARETGFCTTIGGESLVAALATMPKTGPGLDVPSVGLFAHDEQNNYYK